MSPIERNPILWMAGGAAVFGAIAYVGGGPAEKLYRRRADRVATAAVLGSILPLVLQAFSNRP